MMEDSMQFDASLGGSQSLPYAINAVDFAAERCKEIIAMTDCIDNPYSTKLIFQKLPKHMRRRAMSHHCKRLPRRLREGHMNQLSKSGLPPKQKRPSRKYRRRPQNLMLEYLRRQKTNIWMETHIWHSKRFHMVECWGYKLPEAPCDKAFRACFRASSNHCLIQDISYYSCIEISSKYDNLITGFNKITSPKCGLSFASKAYVKGNREGSIELFGINTYPYNAIGKVNYLWKPIDNQDHNNQSKIWIFVHATIYRELVDVLLKCFKLAKVSPDHDNSILKSTIGVPTENVTDMDVEEISTKIPKTKCKTKNNNLKLSKEKLKLSNRNLPFERTPKYVNKDTNIELVELKDTLNRFRLTGPLSQTVLNKTFMTEVESTESKIGADSNWFNKYLGDATNFSTHKMQHEFWERLNALNSPAELAPHMVLGLNIIDPRTNRPKKRTKALPEQSDSKDNCIMQAPDLAHYSPIWSYSLRDEIYNSKLSNYELNKMRNVHNWVPGEVCSLEKAIQRVPVLLIQRPGNNHTDETKLGYGSGWDVIIPAGYAMPVWMSMILFGAKAGGLRESRSIALESGKPIFIPDTMSGKLEEKRTYVKLKNRYFRLPPNKRVNYIKLGINSPFRCNWDMLVNEWSLTKKKNLCVENMFVLRDWRIINDLRNFISDRPLENQIDFKMNCLVTISLILIGKGTPKDFSIICLPKVDDLNGYINNKNIAMLISPTEPLHKDPNQTIRHVSRENHLTLLKKLRRKRVRVKKLAQDTSETPVSIQKAGTFNLVQKQLNKMQELWLPSEISTVRHQCSREVMGFITKGDFSFTKHKGSGIGFVTLASIATLVKQSRNNLVLVRDTTTRQYTFALLSVI